MIKIFKNELLKLKRLYFIEIMMFIPLFFVLTGILNFIRYKSTFLAENPSIWEPIYEQSAIFYGFLLLPILVTVIMSLITHIESKNNNLSKILSLPIRKKNFYIVKFLCGCFLILINILIFILIVTTFGIIFKSSNSRIPLYIIYKPLLSYFSLIPTMAIQYYLSIKFSNIFIPIGLGILFTIISFIGSGIIPYLWFFLPWSYAGKTMSATHITLSLSSTILMFIIAAIITVFITNKGIKFIKNKDIF